MRLSFPNFHNPASAYVHFAESYLHLIDTVAVTDKVKSNLQI